MTEKRFAVAHVVHDKFRVIGDPELTLTEASKAAHELCPKGRQMYVVEVRVVEVVEFPE